jgi:hypothetical protein
MMDDMHLVFEHSAGTMKRYGLHCHSAEDDSDLTILE